MTIEELFDNLCGEKSKLNRRQYIAQFEENIDLINNTPLSNLTHYDYVMRLNSDYGIALRSLGYYTKSLVFLDKAINLIETFPNFKKDKLFEVRSYELVKENKAIALYNLKKYNDSLIIYLELDNAFPNNEKYLGWVYGIKSRKYLLYSNAGLVLGISCILGQLFFKGLSPQLDLILLVLLIFAFLFAGICDLKKRSLLEKAKK
jgi:tetratricopeptide (TPR) repeat protein